jgi:hypothetical protein
MGSPKYRQIRLYVPVDSNNLVLGAIVQGEASAQITQLKVKVMPPPETGVSGFVVLEAAFAFVEKHAFNAPNLDLSALRQNLLTTELRRSHHLEAYGRLVQLLEALGDKHSLVLKPSEAATHRNTGIATGSLEVQLIGRVGYIAVPGFMGADAEASSRFAEDICAAIGRMSADAALGWVVDLRRNTGGNMWPMLRGLSPLLGTGLYGAFRDRHGLESKWDNDRIKGCDRDIPPDVPVAVLVGSRTTSSGEAVAVAFSGRPHARSFGHPTAGLSTANSGFGLPDGGELFLTTAIFVDRTGKAFPAGVEPDVRVEQTGQVDDVLNAALAWLAGPRRL